MEEDSTPKGNFRHLWILFLPLVGTSFSSYLFQLLEKLFLTRVSQEAMEAALNATYVCQLFQLATVAVAMMAQVTVSRYFGAHGKEWRSIGPAIWQFVWFSCFSMVISVPSSILYGHWYFRGTEIETAALPYFYLLISLNFVYPLAVSLSCFFLGMGKTKLVLVATIADQLIKTSLCYFFIFGLDPWILPKGLLGGALANLFAQGILCLILFCLFLQKKNRELFHTSEWKFKPKLFWQSIEPGVFRGLNRIFSYGSWLMIAHLMTSRGGPHLLILSVGGILISFFPFLFEAIYQAQTIVVSQLLGANKKEFLMKAARNGLYLILGTILLIGIPFLGFSTFTCNWLFPGITLDIQSIQILFLGIWSWFAYFTMAALPLSYIFSFKDTKFYFYGGIIFWFTDYYFMYLLLNQMNMDPKYFWLALAIVQATSSLPLYFWRMHILCKRELNSQKLSPS